MAHPRLGRQPGASDGLGGDGAGSDGRDGSDGTGGDSMPAGGAARYAGDLTASGVLVLLAAGIWVESTRWPMAADFAGNPLLVPRALALLMCAVAAVLTWRALHQRRAANRAAVLAGDAALYTAHSSTTQHSPGAREIDSPRAARGDIGRVAWSVVATVALGLLLEPFGVLLAAFSYLLVMQRLTGTPWVRAGLVAAAVSLLIWAVFRIALNVPLPSGTLWD